MLARGAAFVFLAVGLVNAWLVLPLYTGSPADAAGDEELTMASFNVSANNNDRPRVLDWVQDESPDLAILLESTAAWEDEVRAAPSTFGYSIVSDFPQDRRFGITVLSKEPVDESQLLRLGELEDPVIRLVTTFDGRPMVIYAVHPRPATSQDGSEARDSLLEDVAERVTREVDRVVVIGDLNATPWSHAFRSLEADTDLVNSQKGYGLQATWPNLPLWLNIPIDHMLHTDDLTTKERATGPSLGSDHRPLVVTVGPASG